jgi:hypothetical protein
MAILVTFAQQGLTVAKYEQVAERLRNAGQGSPAGRHYHVCHGDKDNLRISDIWESREDFNTFGKTLISVLEDEGLVLGGVQISEVHSTIVGEPILSALRAA